ncbi:protein kinase domain-containing protein [Yeosuana marina]|uniref:protein kinase domain-containing protein n=1 Tax=Yeosuana marina TaxID=1565536 RepID=UPI0030C8D11D
MEELNIKLPKKIKIQGNKIIIKLGDYEENVFTLDGTDYVPYYLDNTRPGNKGGNGYVLKLVEAQNIDEDDIYPKIPDLVIKICKFKKSKFSEHTKSQRFKREIDVLIDCNNKKLPNLICIKNYGIVSIDDFKGKSSDYRYYTMQYADKDLSGFLEENNLDLVERLQLSIDICSALRQLWSLGYYHRDIKPDNILFVNNNWMLSDLGLSEHRSNDFLDADAEWIGPRGWMSPESMNKFLTEKRPWNYLYNCKIDHQSDIFQIGKVLWYIFQGNSPQGGIKRQDFLWKNESVYQILRTMLNNSKEKRIKTIDEIIFMLEKVKSNEIKEGKSKYLYA